MSFAILGVAFVAEGTSFVRALRQAAPDVDTLNELTQTIDKIRRSKDPTVRTVLFEDGAALTGILIFDAVDVALEVPTMHLAPDLILVAARIDLIDGIPGEEVEQVATEIEAALREAEPMVVEVFLDLTARSAMRLRRAGQ